MPSKLGDCGVEGNLAALQVSGRSSTRDQTVALRKVGHEAEHATKVARSRKVVGHVFASRLRVLRESVDLLLGQVSREVRSVDVPLVGRGHPLAGVSWYSLTDRGGWGWG